MFVLGILVGRGLSPVRFDVPKIKGDLVTLKQKVLPKEERGSEAEPDIISEDPDLEFYKALREKPEQAELTAKKAPETPAEPKAVPVRPEAIPEEPEVVSERPAGPPAEQEVALAEPMVEDVELEIKSLESQAKEETTQEPVEKVADEEDPESQKKDQLGRFTIQVAAFKNVDRARELIVYLKKKGYDAYQATTTLPDRGTYHRVRVGHFSNKTDAEQTASRLGKNRLETVIVRE